MSLAALAVVIVVATAGFLLGLAAGMKRVWPTEVARVIAVRARRLAGLDQEDLHLHLPSSDEETEQLDVGTLFDRRSRMIQFIWRDGVSQPNLCPDEVEEGIEDSAFESMGADHIDRLTTRMRYGVDSIAYLFHPRKASGRVMIYHEGHDGGFERARKLIRAFLARGTTVLALSMPLRGMNPRPIVQLRRLGKVRLIEHDWFRFIDAECDDFSSISFFLTPVIAGLNHVHGIGFRTFGMIGISGGGWTTTIAAALDPRIEASYPVAGSLPFYLRATHGELSDYENHLPELYGILNYTELYVLGACGLGRRQTQIMNEHDSVVWPGLRALLYEARVQQALASLGGTFKVYIDRSHAGHKISRHALNLVLEDYAGEQVGLERR